MKCPKCKGKNYREWQNIHIPSEHRYECSDCRYKEYIKETPADEMFAELGLIKNNCNRGNFEYSYQTENGRWQSIMFQVEKKQYHATLQITIEEHKAIHKKLKELGWIN